LFVFLVVDDGRVLKPYVEPVWFEKRKDPLTGSPLWASNGKYWDAKAKSDWSACPDIF
jgi:hypothetical protein